MLDRNRLYLVLMVVFATSCDGPAEQASPPLTIPAPSPAPVPPSAPKKQAAKLQAERPPAENGRVDWVNNPPQLDRIDFSTLTFRSPEQRETIVRWEEAADKLVAAEMQSKSLSPKAKHHLQWHQEPWYLRPDWQRYSRGDTDRWMLRWWSNAADAVTPFGRIEEPGKSRGGPRRATGAESRPHEVRHIYLICHCHFLSGVISPLEMYLSSEWMPEESWGARLFCSSSGTDLDSFSLDLTPRSNSIRSGERISFFHTFGQWEYRATYDEDSTPDADFEDEFDKIHFELLVALPEAKPKPDRDENPLWMRGLISHDMPVQPRLERLYELSESPDAFKQGSLQMLDELEGRIKAGFESGKAIARSYYTLSPAGRTGAEPPDRHWVSAKRKMTAAEKQPILEQALMEIAQRRKLLEENYVEMHTALVKVFPLEALVSEKAMP